ncbi:craniofacial development protein 2-like [Apostichopus japonicus]|uniref:craniofacial development protein 2-like n=1 Tax=Stichopus japonicus TaxID=307972 RepID=UPI003AB2E0B6
MKQKRGRDAHVHNGSNSTGGIWIPENAVLRDVKPQDEELDPKPKGRFNLDGSTSRNHTYLFICTYNVRTLRREEVLDTLLEEVESIKWHIIGLAETGRPSDLIKLTNCGHTLFTTSATSRGCNGVGFLVNKIIEGNTLDYKEVSYRIVYLRLQISKQHTLKVIQVYAPTSSHGDYKIEGLYKNVDDMMATVNSTHTILIGDLNAKIGKKKDSDEKGIGPFRVGDRNKRGQRLLEFVSSRDLIIGNTYFKKPVKRYWTLESPNAATHNLIDYIICDH